MVTHSAPSIPWCGHVVRLTSAPSWT
ncbi:hypothetical protein MED222_06200 [Vibrio sp. MED222]|nr:hypothetical protein MED222_06200 [Vibrio sp. MED222]